MFDFTCFIQNLKPWLDKLKPKAIKCIFIGHFYTQKGYHCFDLEYHWFYNWPDVTIFELVPYFHHPVHVLCLNIWSFLDIQKMRLYLNYCRCISGIQRQWVLLHSQLIQSWLLLILFHFSVMHLWLLILHPLRLRQIPLLVLIWSSYCTCDLSPCIYIKFCFF